MVVTHCKCLRLPFSDKGLFWAGVHYSVPSHNQWPPTVALLVSHLYLKTSMMYVIALCAGVEGTVIAGKLLEKSEEESLGGRLGYNAATDVFEDLVAVGVIDPVKVRLPLPSFHALYTSHALLLRLVMPLLGLRFAAGMSKPALSPSKLMTDRIARHSDMHAHAAGGKDGAGGCCQREQPDDDQRGHCGGGARGQEGGCTWRHGRHAWRLWRHVLRPHGLNHEARHRPHVHPMTVSWV